MLGFNIKQFLYHFKNDPNICTQNNVTFTIFTSIFTSIFSMWDCRKEVNRNYMLI